MKRNSKRILILTPLAIIWYSALITMVMNFNVPFPVGTMIAGFVAVAALCDRKIKSLFLKPYNRFAYFMVFFLVLWFGLWLNLKRAQGRLMVGEDVSDFKLTYYAVETNAAWLLLLLFLILYGTARFTRLRRKNQEDNHPPFLP